MKTIQITVPAFPKKYPVMIGQNMLSTITQQFDFAEYSSVCIITDTNVSELYLDTVKQAISKEVDAGRIHDFVFAAGEKNKSMETVYEGYKTLVSAKADRRTLVVNVGGGVVSDLGGYTAATFLRGIKYINIPTTL